MARFSDLLLKEWTLVGIPIVIGAITALAKVERPIKPEDVKLGETRCLFPRSFPLHLKCSGGRNFPLLTMYCLQTSFF